MDRDERTVVEGATAKLKSIKQDLLKILESEQQQITKSNHMKTIAYLRGNEMELQDGIDLIYKAVGHLMRVKRTH